MMRYSSPPASVTINKNIYKAPNSSQLSDPALITAASPPQQPRASEPRGRKIRTCSNSGEVGHNVRTCPESYCSFCVEDDHKLRDCTLAQEEAEAIKKQEDEEAAVRVPWHITQVDGLWKKKWHFELKCLENLKLSDEEINADRHGKT